MNNITKEMVEHLNLKLKEDGSALTYSGTLIDDNTMFYELTIIDKYVDDVFVSATSEFQKYVRNFFKENYNVEKTGYLNTVKTLIVNV